MSVGVKFQALPTLAISAFSLNYCTFKAQASPKVLRKNLLASEFNQHPYQSFDVMGDTESHW
jgi:hypothetical protein